MPLGISCCTSVDMLLMVNRTCSLKRLICDPQTPRNTEAPRVCPMPIPNCLKMQRGISFPCFGFGPFFLKKKPPQRKNLVFCAFQSLGNGDVKHFPFLHVHMYVWICTSGRWPFPDLFELFFFSSWKPRLDNCYKNTDYNGGQIAQNKRKIRILSAFFFLKNK